MGINTEKASASSPHHAPQCLFGQVMLLQRANLPFLPHLEASDPHWRGGNPWEDELIDGASTVRPSKTENVKELY